MSHRAGERVIQRVRSAPHHTSARRLAFADSLRALPAQAEGSTRSRLLRYGGTVIALGLATALLWPLRQTIGLLNIGLVLLVVVIGATVLAGQRAGIFASLLAFAFLNFFLVPPYLTFEVHDIANLLALFVFLGVSGLISWLVAGAREQAAHAQRRAEDVARLYELNAAIVGARHIDEVLPAIAEKVAEVFEAQACWILLPNAQSQLAVEAQAPHAVRVMTREELSLAEWVFRHGTEAQQGDLMGTQTEGRRAAYMPLRAAQRTIGVLAVADKLGHRPFTTAERTVLATFAAQAAVALERLYLLREAQRAEMLARTDELKSALMSAVSHDLRTPLASIMTSVTSLLEPDIEWNEDTRRDFLQGIYDEARRLNRLVGNLLEMSRIEGGALRPEKDWYSIGEVIGAVVQRLEPQSPDHRIQVDIAPDIPLVLLDFVQVGQVLTNLLENAIRYTPAGTVVRVTATPVEGQVQVRVEDNGPGVSPEHLPHLFEKFYYVDRRNQSKGTGLGLAISKGLVEAHGGRIWATSRPGQGLQVTFTLPLPVTQGEGMPEESALADESAG
jgi:two-component system sensor histidine kinase KdpD